LRDVHAREELAAVAAAAPVGRRRLTRKNYSPVAGEPYKGKPANGHK